MNLSELDIRCPHNKDAKLLTTTTVPDFHPLTRKQLVELLETAITANAVDKSKIQVRLNQAIPGMVCPRPIKGKINDILCKLDSFICAIEEEKLTHPVVVEKIWNLINNRNKEK